MEAEATGRWPDFGPGSRLSCRSRRESGKDRRGHWGYVWLRNVGDSLPDTHQEQADKGSQAVPKRPLVFTLEHTWLQQLQDAQHMQEEGQVVLLPELLEVQMSAAVQEGCDHGQVPGQSRRMSLVKPSPLSHPTPQGSHSCDSTHLSSRMGWATASFRQAMLASATLLSVDRESLVSARSVMKRWMSPSS